MKADLQDKNACDALWNEADLVISCGGTFDERRTVNYWCVELTKPLIEAAVDGMKGQVESVVSNKTVNYSSNGSSIYRLMLKSTLLNNQETNARILNTPGGEGGCLFIYIIACVCTIAWDMHDYN